MTKNYEIARSPGEPPLMLIFPKGAWEQLPYEVRLMCPWFGSEFCSRTDLTSSQHLEISTRDFCIVQVVDAAQSQAA